MKKILLILIFFLSGITIFFHKEIISKGGEYYIRYKLSRYFDSDVAYEECCRQKNGYIFHQMILRKNQEEWKVDRAEISYDFNFTNRNLALDVLLIGPQIKIDQDFLAAKFLSAFASSGLPINFSTAISVKDGSLESTSWTSPVQFHLNMKCGDQSHLCFFARLDPSIEENVLHISCSDHGDKIEGNATFSNVDSARLYSIFQLLFPHYKSWSLNKGELDGNIAFAISKNEQPYASGKLNLRNIEFMNKPTQIGAWIKEANIELNCTKEEGTRNICLEVIEPAKFNFQGVNYRLQLHNLKGKISLNENKSADISFFGGYSFQNNTYPIEVFGLAELGGIAPSVSLECFLHKEKNEVVKAKIYLQEFGRSLKNVDLFLNGLTEEEILLFQNFWGEEFPALGKIKIKKAKADAIIHFNAYAQKLNGIQIKELNIRDLSVFYPPLDLHFSAEKLKTNFNFDFRNSKPFETIQAALEVQEGNLLYQEQKIQGINSFINMHEGTINKIDFTGKYADIEAKVAFKQDPGDRFKGNLDFQGNVENLLKFFPEKLREHVSHLSKDAFQINSKIIQASDGILMEGESVLTAEKALKGKSIQFGLIFTNDIIHTLLSLDRKEDHSSKMQESFKTGWFSAREIPLENYISPLIFPDQVLKIKGTGHFNGLFDAKSISIDYDAYNFVLENEDLCLQIPKFSLHENEYPARYRMDLISGEYVSTIPMREGNYFEKNTGLMFTDIVSEVTLEKGLVQINNLSAYSNGILFGGNILVDYRDPAPKVFDVDMQIEFLHAKISQLQQFFTHFKKPLFFTKLPIDGNVFLTKNPGQVHFHFFPGDYNFSCLFKGGIEDGTLSARNSPIVLHDLHADFDYDYKKNNFDLSNLHGVLLIGKGSKADEYFLKSENLHFTDFEHNEAEFDIVINDFSREKVRFSGKTVARNRGTATEKIEILLNNEISHFGILHPFSSKLILQNWDCIDSCSFAFSFPLQEFVQDFFRFQKTGCWEIPAEIFGSAENFTDCKGDIDLSLQYDNTQSIFEFSLQGKNLFIGNKKYHNGFISGYKIDKRWSIDTFQLDNWSLAADFHHKEDCWALNFLGLRYGESFLTGLDGCFTPATNHFEGKINLLEFSFDDCKEWPFAADFYQACYPSGHVHANGVVSLDLFKDQTLCDLDVNLNVSIKSPVIKGLALNDIDQVHFSYATKKGIHLENFDLFVKNGLQNPEFIPFRFKEIAYEPINKQFKLNGLEFWFDLSSLRWTMNIVNNFFPSLLDAGLLNSLQYINNEEMINGIVDLEFCENKSTVKLYLGDLLFKVKQKEYKIKDFLLTRDPDKISFSGTSHYEKRPFWISGIAISPFEQIELTLYDSDPKNSSFEPCALKIQLQKNELKEFVVKRMCGDFSGLSINLKKETYNQNPTWNALSGEVSVNAHFAKFLCCPQTEQKIDEWQIGNGYRLIGKWLWPENGEGEEVPLLFKGKLEGLQCELRGYLFTKIEANVDCEIDKITLRDLFVEDFAGTLEIPCLFINNVEERQKISIPTFCVSNFRPCLLRLANQIEVSPYKPLLIRELIVNNFDGIIGDYTSYTGEGSLTFTNHKKDDMQNTIFAIPRELLIRIGLDIRVLTPIKGSIFFYILGDKIYPTKFKGMYSEGRGSKFYLPKSARDHSWIDFDGNLHIHVRMRHYNLLFKLTELFTFTIRGTLQKPTYSLRKSFDGDD